MSLAMRSDAWAMSEVPLLLLLLHGGRGVVIDDPALPFRALRQQHLLDDFGKGDRLALHGSRERITAERTEAYAAHLGPLAWTQRHALVINHDEGSIALHHRTAAREIQRHDGNALQVDVLPDIELGPVGNREHADALALVLARVVQAPQLGPLVLRIPAMLGRAERENPLLRPALLLIAPGSAERHIEAIFVERLLEALRLHDIGVDLRAVREGIDSLRQAVRIHVDDQVHTELPR